MSTPQNPQNPMPQENVPAQPANGNPQPYQPQMAPGSDAGSMPQYGAPAGSMPQYGAPVAPAPEPSKKKNILGPIISGIIVLALLGGGALVWNLIKGNNADGTMKVGSCYEVSIKKGGSAEKDADFKKGDCDDKSKVTFLVTSEGTGDATSSTCQKYQMAFTYENKKKHTKQYSCLTPNLFENICYVDPDSGPMTVAACTDSEAIKITKRIEGKADSSLCEGGAGITYKDPDRTYCGEPAN